MHPVVTSISERLTDPFRRGTIGALVLFISLVMTAASCSEIQKPEAEPFFSQTKPPVKQEFRWSNGKTIKSFDPALASAPPETDVARALFEGLTQLDARTLNEVPAAAKGWSSSRDNRVWTFQLRENAKWSDGKPVIAEDFVRGWKRLSKTPTGSDIGFLIDNIAGMRALRRREAARKPASELLSNTGTNSENEVIPQVTPRANANTAPPRASNSQTADGESQVRKAAENEIVFGAEAVGDLILRVTLVNPDKDFPKLVAHPIFSPIASEGPGFQDKERIDIKTNGAFRIAEFTDEALTLERAPHYWDRDAIQLERVRFVPMKSSETALQAYRDGEIDALTNAELEPLAQKLLSPYNDFRQNVHNALNFYEFNLAQAPFTDRRVREALTLAIERERLTEGEMKGATQPAYHLFAFEGETDVPIERNVEKAKRLLETAGFPNGDNFPVIRLVVNRNDTQMRVARSVARMWKADLNVDTEIVVKESLELDKVKSSGDYDLIRRGLVFPSVDRNASLAAIFLPRPHIAVNPDVGMPSANTSNTNSAPALMEDGTLIPPPPPLRRRIESEPAVMETTLEDAVFEFRVVPLYFPVSYSLVKPYVQGFDTNGLDAPSLKTVVINSNWQPEKQ